MKKVFGVALLALPFLAVSAQAQVGYSSLQIGGSFSMTFRNNAFPQAGPWYLYWPLEGHFVAPAPTGYPYWPNPQGLPKTAFGGPVVPPPHGPAYAPPAPAPAPGTVASPANAPPSTRPTASLQPTSYYPLGFAQPTANYYPTLFIGQPPSYWYDR
jgi:hypothetical protein